MLVQLLKTAIGRRKVTRSTRKREMPSMPSDIDTPHSGIHAQVLVSWKAGPAGSYAHHIPSDRTNSISKMTKGSQRANAS
jgi:hypothetical protein